MKLQFADKYFYLSLHVAMQFGLYLPSTFFVFQKRCWAQHIVSEAPTRILLCFGCLLIVRIGRIITQLSSWTQWRIFWILRSAQNDKIWVAPNTRVFQHIVELSKRIKILYARGLSPPYPMEGFSCWFFLNNISLSLVIKFRIIFIRS